ncbi:MAG: bifunctional folylpolyglutamate synthase/dihydrofolate synthase, partial [Ferrovum sp.]|nr:bifunctional folylpolyglutamate synthase/dihydrofolate synthase [Ferrovum sp.]
MARSPSPPVAGPKTLAAWLAHTEQLHAQTIDMGLARVSQVRDAMTLHPDFPIITVAGTNGKGSTCTLLAACLSAAGYRVGVYSSPHLMRYNERVRVGSAFASDQSLCDAFAKVEAARGEQSLTPFEFGTLAAMQVFIEAGLDVVILEVGLGGRLDAVNIFDSDCAIVTSIAIDHEAWLGTTREAIAFEKAGVFRAGCPAICADPEPPAAIAETATRVGAQLLQMDRDFSCQVSADQWSFTSGARTLAGLPRLKLSGAFQYRNAAAALAALISLEDRLPVSLAAFREG